VELDLGLIPGVNGAVVSEREYRVESCIAPTCWRQYVSESLVWQIQIALVRMQRVEGTNTRWNKLNISMQTKNDYKKRDTSKTWDGVNLGLKIQRHGIAITKDIPSEGMAVSHETRFLQLYISRHSFCPLSLLSKD
jgi:hypothetical protein